MIRRMPPTFVHIGLPESPFGARFAEAVRSLGIAAETASIDATIEGGTVTVRSDAVLWERIPLLEAVAVVVEAPLFPWPQPLGAAPRGAGAPLPFAVEREARSLALSALSLVAETRPVWNRPAAAHLAASRAVALARLETAGIPVRAWKLLPAPERGDREDGIVLDSVGRDRWHRPSRPSPGEPSLVLGPVAGDVVSVLVAGGAAAGGERHPSAAAWSSGSPGAPLASGAIPKPFADAAIAAARALGLDIAAVALAGDPAATLLVETGPDLSAWDDLLAGRLAPFLAGRLAGAALAR